MEYTESQQKAIALADAFAEQYFKEEDIKQWVRSRGLPPYVEESFVESEMWTYVGDPDPDHAGVDMLTRATLIARLHRHAGAALPVVSDATSIALLAAMRRVSQDEIIDHFSRHGKRFGFCQAFSESNAGSDASAVSTTVSWDSEGVYLTGEKSFVTAGQFMPEALVLAHDPVFGGADGGLSLWLVPLDTPGVSTYPIETIGQEMLAPALLRFDDVALKPEWQIQTEGKLDAMLKRQYETGRIIVCAESLGLAEAALDDAVAYSKRHLVKGKRLCSIAQVQEKLVAMEAKVRAIRMFVYDAASSVNTEEMHLNCALMKRFVPELATDVASMALQVFGGRGYTDEERVGRIWRDCRGNQIAQGADEVMTHVAAKFIVG